MASHSTLTAVAAASALLCLSLHSIGFATPQASPMTQTSLLRDAPALGSNWEPQTTAPTTSGPQAGILKAFGLSAAVGCAVGMRSRIPMRQSTKTPEETYKVVIAGGEARLGMSARDIILQGIVTGFYIGFGGVLCSTVGGSLPDGLSPGIQRFTFGAFGFPLSIFLTTIAGGQGFTPNIAVMATALFRKGSNDKERSERTGTALKNLLLAYCGNAIGLVTIAWLANQASLPAVPAAMEIAKHKVFDMTPLQVVVRGILGGWLIGLAVWTAQAAQSVGSKFVTIWLCISTYVMCQYEHCLANIFFVPCAIFAGAPITWKAFLLKNLIPSTIGNLIGGCGMLAGMYRSVYGRKAFADEQKAGTSAPAVAAPAAAPVAAAPAPAPAPAPVAAAPAVVAPVAAAPAGNSDLAEQRKQVDLLKWAAQKLSNDGSPLATAAMARAQQAEAAYKAMEDRELSYA